MTHFILFFFFQKVQTSVLGDMPEAEEKDLWP